MEPEKIIVVIAGGEDALTDEIRAKITAEYGSFTVIDENTASDAIKSLRENDIAKRELMNRSEAMEEKEIDKIIKHFSETPIPSYQESFIPTVLKPHNQKHLKTHKSKWNQKKRN